MPFEKKATFRFRRIIAARPIARRLCLLGSAGRSRPTALTRVRRCASVFGYLPSTTNVRAYRRPTAPICKPANSAMGQILPKSVLDAMSASPVPLLEPALPLPARSSRPTRQNHCDAVLAANDGSVALDPRRRGGDEKGLMVAPMWERGRLACMRPGRPRSIVFCYRPQVGGSVASGWANTLRERVPAQRFMSPTISVQTSVMARSKADRSASTVLSAVGAVA